MNITIIEVVMSRHKQYQTTMVYESTMVYGDKTVKARFTISESEIAPSIKFNDRLSFSNAEFYWVLSMTGMLSIFVDRCFLMFRGETFTFPWNMGQHDDAKIQKGIENARELKRKKLLGMNPENWPKGLC